MAQLRQAQGEVQSRGARLVVVSQDCGIIPLASPLEAYCDPQRDLFRALGFRQASRWEPLDPHFWVKAARLMARGRLPGTSQMWDRQLGGVALFDSEGQLVMHRAAARIAEPLDLGPVLAALEALHQPPEPALD
ncbi:MAG TPA: AhpC/TSA family protein [Candidatus Nitrosotenuis sp.]|nr:AhpC/TSA family protein [Candidatus Nitrosotenuis sp.]